ncbi:MAG TPA: YihY/virulence factor BrkB family protein [Ktedonobacterales bacterium]|nr:YihY/virulence factor BrkB family protein [Ktedonobacterales bacterium]
MVAATSGTASSAGHERGDATSEQRPGLMTRLKPRLAVLSGFWTKISNDSIFNLSGLLAYNFLMSVFPILLVILAISGFFLERASPGQYAALQKALVSAFPRGTGRQVLVNVTNNLNKSAGLLFIVGFVVALVSGSGLFLTLEWTFGIVFRLRGRDPIHQRLMSIGMLLLYTVLIPIVLLASLLPSVIVRALPIGHDSPVFGFFLQAAGDIFSLLVAALLFGAIYIVVPNRKVEWHEVWKGTLVAATLLVLYEMFFPFYVSTFLHPQNYGSTAGFAVVILIFFYYLAFILVLGAEINSWVSGQRETAGDIPSVLHELQAHNTTRGAAGPTAGLPREDMAHHKGATAMRTTATAVAHERDDHRGSTQPPKFAEAGVDAPGYDIEPRGRHDAIYAETLRAQPLTRPLGARQKRALWAVLTAGAVAIIPVLRLLPDLLRDEDRTTAGRQGK